MAVLGALVALVSTAAAIGTDQVDLGSLLASISFGLLAIAVIGALVEVWARPQGNLPPGQEDTGLRELLSQIIRWARHRRGGSQE